MTLPLNVYDSVQHLESENIYCIVGGSGFIRHSIIEIVKWGLKLTFCVPHAVSNHFIKFCLFTIVIIMSFMISQIPNTITKY